MKWLRPPNTSVLPFCGIALRDHRRRIGALQFVRHLRELSGELPQFLYGANIKAPACRR
jgi:hypothetical protein